MKIACENVLKLFIDVRTGTDDNYKTIYIVIHHVRNNTHETFTSLIN